MARVAVVAIALLALLSVAYAANPAVKKPAAKAAVKAKAPSIYDKNVKAAVAALGKKPNYKSFPQLFSIACK